MYRMITTFELPGGDALRTLKSVKQWYLLSEFFYWEKTNPYVSGIHELVSDDLSYVEFYVLFHDKEFFELWFELFNNKFLECKVECYNGFKEKGLIIKEYIESFDVISEGMQPMSEFVTRFPSKLTKNLISA